jgi:hypothetical protein
MGMFNAQLVDYTLKINNSEETRSDSSSRDECKCNNAKKRGGVCDGSRRKISREWIGRRHGRWGLF